MPTIALALCAVALSLPGLVGLFAPSLIAGHALSADAANEARAVGGSRLGIAVLLAIAAYSPGQRRAGVVAACVVFGATLLGRVVSNVLDGAPGPMLKPEILEAVLLGLSLLALRAKH